MRTLERNETTLWVIEPTGKTPLLDSDGFDTGEFIVTYSVPKKIGLSLFVYNGKVAEKIFGTDVSADMMAVSCTVDLDKKSLLFLTLPTGNFTTTYDYRVKSIKKSLNTFNYALESRT